MLSDLRESGSIEQDADLVVFIFREEYYDKEHRARRRSRDIIIAKHRNGAIGDVKLTLPSRVSELHELPGASSVTQRS